MSDKYFQFLFLDYYKDKKVHFNRSAYGCLF